MCTSGDEYHTLEFVVLEDGLRGANQSLAIMQRCVVEAFGSGAGKRDRSGYHAVVPLYVCGADPVPDRLWRRALQRGIAARSKGLHLELLQRVKREVRRHQKLQQQEEEERMSEEVTWSCAEGRGEEADPVERSEQRWRLVFHAVGCGIGGLVLRAALPALQESVEAVFTSRVHHRSRGRGGPLRSSRGSATRRRSLSSLSLELLSARSSGWGRGLLRRVRRALCGPSSSRSTPTAEARPWKCVPPRASGRSLRRHRWRTRRARPTCVYEVEWSELVFVCCPHLGVHRTSPSVLRELLGEGQGDAVPARGKDCCTTCCREVLKEMSPLLADLELRSEYLEETLLSPRHLSSLRRFRRKVFMGEVSDPAVWNYSSSFWQPLVEQCCCEGWEPSQERKLQTARKLRRCREVLRALRVAGVGVGAGPLAAAALEAVPWVRYVQPEERWMRAASAQFVRERQAAHGIRLVSNPCEGGVRLAVGCAGAEREPDACGVAAVSISPAAWLGDPAAGEQRWPTSPCVQERRMAQRLLEGIGAGVELHSLDLVAAVESHCDAALVRAVLETAATAASAGRWVGDAAFLQCIVDAAAALVWAAHEHPHTLACLPLAVEGTAAERRSSSLGLNPAVAAEMVGRFVGLRVATAGGGRQRG